MQGGVRGALTDEARPPGAPRQIGDDEVAEIVRWTLEHERTTPFRPAAGLCSTNWSSARSARSTARERRTAKRTPAQDISDALMFLREKGLIPLGLKRRT
jgi:hypothetical protein